MSHAWQDGYKRKVQMLRAFLCLDALLAQTTVTALLLACFLLPLGAGISAWVFSFPFWAPSLLPLAILALVLLWVVLSCLGAMPRAWRPWALSPRTIWLDKCACSRLLTTSLRPRPASLAPDPFSASCVWQVLHSNL